MLHFFLSSRTDPDDDVVDVTSFSALDVVEMNKCCIASKLSADGDDEDADIGCVQKVCVLDFEVCDDGVTRSRTSK